MSRRVQSAGMAAGLIGLVGLVNSPAGAWYDSASYATLSHVADFNNDRYAMPAFGSELVLSPTMDSDAGMGASSNWAVTGGLLVHSAASTGGFRVSAVGAITAGKTYYTSYTITAQSAAGSGVNIRLGGSNLTIRSAVGTYTEYFTATTTGSADFIARGGSGDWLGSIDNVSVKEVILTPTGRTYGPELLLNGDFSVAATGNPATGWALKTPVVGTETMTISGGTLNLTGDGTNAAYADQSFTTVNGQVYEITLTQGSSTSAINIGTSQGSSAIGLISGVLGTMTFKFTATGTTTWLRFAKTSAALATVDNVSIRALTAIGTYPKREATFDEFFAFAAASDVARTYTDVNGVLKNNLAVNARRMTYANAKRQLRLENAGTNIITYSETLDNVQYTNDNVTVTSIANGWWSYRETVTNSFHRTVRSAGTVVASTTYTLSALVRKVGRRYLFARTDLLVAGASRQVGFDLDTLTVPYASAGLTGAIRQVGTDMFLLSVTGTTDATTTARTIGFGSANATVATDTIPSFAGDITQGFDIRYMQFEANAFATDHIPTQAASVTRAIETARFSPAVEAVLQRAQGTVVVRQLLSAVGDGGNSRRIIGNQSSDYMLSALSSTGVRTGGASGMNATLGGAGSLLAAAGEALGFDASGRSLVANGGTVASDANAPSARTEVYLGRSNTVTAATMYGDGYYDLVGFSPERLPPATLQALAVAA